PSVLPDGHLQAEEHAVQDPHLPGRARLRLRRRQQVLRRRRPRAVDDQALLRVERSLLRHHHRHPCDPGRVPRARPAEGNHPMSEQSLPLSEQDERDLAMLDPDNEATKRCLLELWNEVLSNVEAIAEQPIPVQVSAKIVATWPQMTWQDTAIYHQRYHQMLIELRETLRGAIRQHPGCTDHVGPDDAAENHDIYKDVLVAWHLTLDK